MKRVLVLLLIICLISGLPTSHAARNADSPETAKKEAVELLHCLNIINDSYDTFEPNKLITRADAARMIYIIIKGGNDDGAINFTGQSNTFSDISGHPAEGYINYSFAMGFISGYSDGTFKPNRQITGYAFLKIALAVIGYDAKIEGFEGKNWDQKVVARAMTSGILKDYNGTPHDPINAIDAVCILYNTLFTSAVEYTRSGELRKTGSTVADAMFGLRTYSGILWATDQAALGIAPIAGNSKSWIDLNGDEQFDSRNEVFNTTADTSLLGSHVTIAVRVRDDSVIGVYGLYATPGMSEKMQISNLTPGNSSKDVLYFYNFESDADNDDDGIMDGLARATYVEYIDNNGDGKCDVVLSWSYTYAAVTSKRFDENKQTVEYHIAIEGRDSVLFLEDYTGLNAVSEGDRIIYLEGNSSMKKGIIKVIEPIKGSITSIRVESVYFNGKPCSYSQVNGSLERRPGFGAVNENIGKDALLYAYNGSVLEIAPTIDKNTPEAFAYVFQIEYTDILNGNFEEEIYDRSYTAQVVLEDGSIHMYRLRQVDGAVLPGSNDIDASPEQGLYRYRINSFGQLELKTVYVTAQRAKYVD
ncbi:MAG: S-layer homology domain-containing protein [Clostridiales bacterium]|nr:S-layer homology domain-containing protein [Clostridiales bacterium]